MCYLVAFYIIHRPFFNYTERKRPSIAYGPARTLKTSIQLSSHAMKDTHLHLFNFADKWKAVAVI